MKDPDIQKRGTALQAVLFGIGVLLFGWPLVSVAAQASLASLYAYLYLVWGAFVAAAYWSTRRAQASSSHLNEPLGHEDSRDD